MRTTIALVALATLAASCAPADGTDPGDSFVVPDGKLDDFLSLTAQEYVIEGRATVTVEQEYLEGDEDALEARVRELVGYRNIAIAWFLTQYFIDKNHDDSNQGYGGYGAMARANTYDALDIRAEPELGQGVYSFAVSQLIAGRRDLLDRLPVTEREDGSLEFVLVVGTPSNEEMARLETNGEWYRDAPWTSWNPENVDPSRREDLSLTIRPEVASEDAWLDYPVLLEDALLTVDVHLGWDYHNNYHVVHAQALFDWLRRQGYEAPVQTFAELDRQSGPFTKTLVANGRVVGVEVRLFYGKTGSDTDPDTAAGGRQLEDDMRESLRTRDVIVFSGHSGPFYGFALANWRRTDEGDLDDSEMSSVDFPEARYQLVVAEGCDTYHIGEAFRRNPAKPDGRYIDIITTTAPSNASTPGTVQDVIGALTETDRQGAHDPRTIMRLLRDLDSNSSWFHTMYGVHGIDDNPRAHPWGVMENLCAECAADADCGGPGNRCIEVSEETGRRCGVSCTADAGCPEGYQCRAVASHSTSVIVDSVCVPRTLVCGQ